MDVPPVEGDVDLRVLLVTGPDGTRDRGGRALFSDPTPLRVFAALRPASAMIGDVVFDSARIGHAVAAACLARYNRVSARAIVSDDRCRPHR